MNLNLPGSPIQLLPEKAIYLAAVKTLVVADLHFGKVNHFRRAGLPVPSAANLKNTETLIDLINRIAPERTIFLGDLFHSHYNNEWEVVGQIVNHFSACRFDLVRGNHDIMSAQQYARKGIRVLESENIGGYHLTHEPLEKSTTREINIAGHLHPGAHLRGKGRQAITLPCFWLSTSKLILPAFGSFTGLAAVYPEKNDTIYVVAEAKVIEVTPEPANRNRNVA